VLGIARQAYYQRCSAPVSQRDWDDAHLIDAALGVHADDPADGYRFIADELARRGFTASEQAGPPVHDDLVRRDFTANTPNAGWLTDITEHPTSEGKPYLCAIKDCYSNKFVGYSIDSHMRASLAVAALRNAIALRDPRETVVHSDRGAQFRSAAYRRILRFSRADRVDEAGRRVWRQRSRRPPHCHDGLRFFELCCSW
jgi:transposase InsO family protein